MPDDDVAAVVNLLQQAKVAIEQTLDAIEHEHPGVEVSGYAFQPLTFYSPALTTSLITRLPGTVRPGLANESSNEGCKNLVC